MTIESSAAELNAVYRKIAIRIVPFLILGYIMAYLDRSNIGFARVDMIGDLGFSELVFGIGAGLFYLGYSAFEVPSNLMMKKIVIRRVRRRRRKRKRRKKRKKRKARSSWLFLEIFTSSYIFN
jgi:sugar phosphate permease